MQPEIWYTGWGLPDWHQAERKGEARSPSSQTLALSLTVTDLIPGSHVLHLQQRPRFDFLPTVPAGSLFSPQLTRAVLPGLSSLFPHLPPF